MDLPLVGLLVTDFLTSGLWCAFEAAVGARRELLTLVTFLVGEELVVVCVRVLAKLVWVEAELMEAVLAVRLLCTGEGCAVCPVECTPWCLSLCLAASYVCPNMLSIICCSLWCAAR